MVTYSLKKKLPHPEDSQFPEMSLLRIDKKAFSEVRAEDSQKASPEVRAEDSQNASSGVRAQNLSKEQSSFS